MKPHEQDKFVNDIMEDFSELLKKKVSKFPEEWDGHEIRQFIADLYSEHYLIGTALTGKRKMEYKNYVIVNNLT